MKIDIHYVFFLALFQPTFAQKINRRAVVERHKVVLSQFDTLASLSVGNGRFAFTVDATGLQTFPVYYQNGIPLGTQSEWGWHSFPNTQNYKIEETLKPIKSHGREVQYAVQWTEAGRQKDAANYIRQNPHRLQLGNLGFELTKKDSSALQPSDIQNIKQILNPWTGEIASRFEFEGQSIEIQTVCYQDQDVIKLKIKSDLLRQKRLKLFLRFPYPTDQFSDVGTNYQNSEAHLSEMIGANTVKRQLDSMHYFVSFESKRGVLIRKKAVHYFSIEPIEQDAVWELAVSFSSQQKQVPILSKSSKWGMSDFWKSGAAIDFSGSSDPRAFELERRIVLSQYLTKIQCAGNAPPQETGLTYNSWYGKPHLEMHWWHGVHFALWGRPTLLENSMAWYETALPTALKIARRQGFKGARWQKMTDDKGGETASSVGSYLIWQQPHIITFLELIYAQKHTRHFLNKYKNLVFKTADFMASFAYFDAEKKKYILGTGIIPAQERFKPASTFNPTYELNYWHWALNTAQQWRKHLGLKPNPKWQEVIDHLSPLPIKDGVYLATESTPDSYTNPYFLTDHPTVLGTLGMLPMTKLVNKKIMTKTLNKVLEVWHWNDTWGWDFPLAAMAATRLGQPEKAVDALMMQMQTNTYLPNGHNYQNQRLRLYLPGNGGLLAAVAMICTYSGFPKKGWKVRWERGDK